MTDILRELQEAGLTGNEAKVYHALLSKGEQGANTLSEILSMDRTLTYTVLNHLIEKGLVNYIVRNNLKIFSSASPQNLLNPLKEKIAFTTDLIPKLESVEQQKIEEHEVIVYEGKEGIRTYGQIMLKHKEMFSFGATGRAYNLLYEAPHIAKEFEKRNIKGKIITSPELAKHPMKIKNFELRFLNVNSEATTTIFGDYVGIHHIKEKPIIILIKNKDIANTYLEHFHILWNLAKK